MDIQELRKEAHHLKPMVRIGKAGLGDHVFAEVDKQLERHELVKIRLLRSFSELYAAGDAAALIAERTHSRIVQKIGDTLVLYRGKGKEKRG